jgi:hypothetical protein
MLPYIKKNSRTYGAAVCLGKKTNIFVSLSVTDAGIISFRREYCCDTPHTDLDCGGWALKGY